MILQRIKISNDTSVAFIIDKNHGVQTIQKLNGSVLGGYRPSALGGIAIDVIGFGNVLASLAAD
ncbi:MAG: hypothetical protein Q7T96_08690 [Methylobacter sp.]|nr:hypothetical protein [Methylobacter sp.]